MNKQSNTYTIGYILLLVLVVGAALSYTAISLQPRQKANADADKMRQILASVHITAPSALETVATYDKYITDSYIVDSTGRKVPGDAFGVNVAAQVKEADSDRLLPVYQCTLDNGDIKYILPMYGAGLWGPIWGYIALDADGSTVYGAYFAHQGETPGLGAEIEKPRFSKQFDGKNLFKDGRFMPIAVVKAGQQPAAGQDYVDGISGGTITSKGVSAMLSDCLQPYRAFLSSLKK